MTFRFLFLPFEMKWFFQVVLLIPPTLFTSLHPPNFQMVFSNGAIYTHCLSVLFGCVCLELQDRLLKLITDCSVEVVHGHYEFFQSWSFDVRKVN